MKTCTQCLAVKPIEDFGFSAQSSSGRKAECLLCSRTRMQNYYKRKRGELDTQLVVARCATCGADFRKSSTNAKKVYCDRACQARAAQQRRSDRVRAQPMQRHCKKCGAEVEYRVGVAVCDGCKIDPRPRRTEYDRRRTLTRYGVTQLWYDATLAEQGGCCAICGTDRPGHRRESWSIDHDHSYLLGDPRGVRGLLCSSCNLGIGQLGDLPSRLRDAALYLERHSLAINDRKAA